METVNEDPYGDLIASNQEQILGIYRSCHHYATALMKEASMFHPMHEDTYPPTLAKIKQAEQAAKSQKEQS